MSIFNLIWSAQIHGLQWYKCDCISGLCVVLWCRRLAALRQYLRLSTLSYVYVFASLCSCSRLSRILSPLQVGFHHPCCCNWRRMSMNTSAFLVFVNLFTCVSYLTLPCHPGQSYTAERWGVYRPSGPVHVPRIRINRTLFGCLAR